ncbi:hypothetical protein R1flu_002929 [Riccia fluitans]|uniref:Uncharacterized protein n=1 Tax=Riccia fluitans TaxID=41844 RepID=A0ABD1Y7I7_9MARC
MQAVGSIDGSTFAREMGKEGSKEGGSWIKSLKKAIRQHIHGDLDEDIVRFPHLPHKKSARVVKITRSPPMACCSAGNSSRSCACSCRKSSSSSQVSKTVGRSTISVDIANSSNGGSLRSISLDDCGSSTGSCSISCACSTSNSRRLHPLGDRCPPTEEPSLHYAEENEVDDHETITTLVNLWGPR